MKVFVLSFAILTAAASAQTAAPSQTLSAPPADANHQAVSTNTANPGVPAGAPQIRNVTGDWAGASSIGRRDGSVDHCTVWNDQGGNTYRFG